MQEYYRVGFTMKINFYHFAVLLFYEVWSILMIKKQSSFDSIP